MGHLTIVQAEMSVCSSSVIRNLPAMQELQEPHSVPGSGGSTGEEKGNPLQYSCLENLMDTGAWWATVHRITESETTEVT